MYWWPDMHADVKAVIDECAGCMANKASTGKPTGVAKSLPTPELPWQRFSLDWMKDKDKANIGQEGEILSIKDTQRYKVLSTEEEMVANAHG